MAKVENPWSKHYQASWQERAADHNLPMWLRIAAAAYGNHAANGHAVFRRGDLRTMLGRPGEDGQIIKPDAANVRRALEIAVRHGWLHESSTTMCLVVPAHSVEGGVRGRPDDVCPLEDQHVKRTRARRKARGEKYLRAL